MANKEYVNMETYFDNAAQTNPSVNKKLTSTKSDF